MAVRELTQKFTRNALRLAPSDRQRLSALLAESLVDRREVNAARLSLLGGAMEDLLGMSLRTPSRLSRLVYARYVFCYEAAREGFTQTEIADYLGRDHSTVSYGIRRVQDALAMPQLYADTIELYNNFMQSI